MKKRIAYGLLGLVIAGFVALALSFHVWFWPSELIISMTPQIIMALGVILTGALFYLLYRVGAVLLFKRPLFIAVLAIIIASGAYAVSHSLTVQPTIQMNQEKPAEAIRFATFNKLHSNDNYQKIADYIRQQNIDVIALQEVKPHELQTMSELTGYTHSFHAKSLHATYGSTVGILSRLPINSTYSTELGGGYAVVKAEIDIHNKGPVAFYSFHVTPPFTPALYDQSRLGLKQFADIIAGEKLPVVAGGDFNTTIFSPKLRHFNTTTQQAVKPITAEHWPKCSWYGFSPLLCMRIDHIYLPPIAELYETTIGPDLGSDHRMIITELSL